MVKISLIDPRNNKKLSNKDLTRFKKFSNILDLYISEKSDSKEITDSTSIVHIKENTFETQSKEYESSTISIMIEIITSQNDDGKKTLKPTDSCYKMIDRKITKRSF